MLCFTTGLRVSLCSTVSLNLHNTDKETDYNSFLISCFFPTEMYIYISNDAILVQETVQACGHAVPPPRFYRKNHTVGDLNLICCFILFLRITGPSRWNLKRKSAKQTSPLPV